jgi:hypothetical protein
MVMRLASALDLAPREQNSMLVAAGLSAVFPNRPLEDAEMARFQAVVESLLAAHEPMPAAVIDRYGSIMRANSAFERLSPGLIGAQPEDMVDMLFGVGPWRDSLANWPEVAGAWVDRQRQEARRTGDPRLESLISRAEALAGPLRRPSRNSDAPTVCSKIRLGDDVLELFSVVVRFDNANDVTLSEIRIELLYPANEAAERFFQNREPASSDVR